jgi:hypothetical protein
VWCVLAQDGDVEAQWITGELRARADRPVLLVTASTLVHDCRWELRVGADGARARVEIADGTALDLSTLDAVVNRLCWLGAEGFLGATDADRDYATSERYALGLAWLESLGRRVVNRPAGSGLAGAYRSTAEWRTMARSAGLPVVPYTSDDPTAAGGIAYDESDRPVLVVDGRVVEPPPGALAGDHEPLPAAVQQKLVVIQEMSGLDLVEVRLSPDPGIPEGWRMRDVPFLATMSAFGDPGLDALAAALQDRSPSREICGLARRAMASLATGGDRR